MSLAADMDCGHQAHLLQGLRHAEQGGHDTPEKTADGDHSDAVVVVACRERGPGEASARCTYVQDGRQHA